MSQVLIPTAILDEYYVKASILGGYTVLTAVQQLNGYIQSANYSRDNAYATYAVGIDGFELPRPGEGSFRVNFAGHSVSSSTNCGNLQASAYPVAKLFIKGTLKATLTATSTYQSFKTAAISAADVASITKLSDITVQAIPRTGMDRCLDYSEGQEGRWRSVEAFGKVYSLEVILPDGPPKTAPSGLGFGCMF